VTREEAVRLDQQNVLALLVMVVLFGGALRIVRSQSA
jgi:hypothetical protein